MTPAERVRRLVEAGTVAPEEGERLLSAMSNAPKRSALATLVNPFERFGGGVAVVLGAVVSALSVAVTRLGVRFDGFLDMHVQRAVVAPIHVSLLEQLAAWILPAMVFWAFARAFTKHARLVDFIGMVGLARLPVFLSALAGLALVPAVPVDPTSIKLTPGLLVLAAVAIVLLAANITLLYQGFKNASGLTGPKLVGGFIALLFGAEALSKLVVVFLL